MSFITPALALAGLIAVAIPIIIHLLARQRRRPVEWAAMRFLIEAFRKHRRRLQLEQIILLAIRCLALLLLGAALARPLLSETGLIDVSAARAVYLLIDNGLASGLQDEEGTTSLERHIAQAREVVESLKPGDRVGVITAARPVQRRLTPPSSDHGAVIDLLESLEPTQAPTDFSAAVATLRSVLREQEDEADHNLVYLFSDFRAGSAGLDAPLPTVLNDLGDAVTLLASPPASATAPNVQVAAVEPLRSVVLPGVDDGSRQVVVRLTRQGGEHSADVTRVRLVGESLPTIEPRVVRWEPGQSEAQVEFAINPTSFGNRAMALTAIIDDDRLNADNQRHRVVEVRQRARIVMLDRRNFGLATTVDRLTGGQWLRRALEPVSGGALEVVEVDPAALDPADLNTADVVIAPRPDLLVPDGWRSLRAFIDRGGLLVVLPPEEINVHQWVDHVRDELSLPVQIALEPRDAPDGLPLASEQPSSEMLRLLASDMDELVRPVHSFRLLDVDPARTQAMVLLEHEDGSPFALQTAPREQTDENGGAAEANTSTGPDSLGMVVLFTVAPELRWTNLPTKPLMVPLLQEIVRQGLSLIRSGQESTVGQSAIVQATASVSDVQSPEGERIAMRGARTREALMTAGVYNLLDAGGQSVGRMAVNVDPSSGASQVQSADEVNAWLAESGPWTTFDPDDLDGRIQAAESRSPLAGILLWVLLALVLLETVLARWFSHAMRGGETPVIADQSHRGFGSNVRAAGAGGGAS